jgi:hypothetical protein
MESRLVGQETISFLWNQKLHYRFARSGHWFLPRAMFFESTAFRLSSKGSFKL